MTDAVQLRNVSYHYPGTTQGVQGVDLSIAAGELLVCVGPSGCGKTTLLKLIAGFIAPDRGTILVDGADVTGVSARERNCGIVFQSYALFPTMRAWENVAYPLRVRGVEPGRRREQARAMLDIAGIGEMAERMPASLSGGQQQRVALARALVFNPKALLLDEPLSALDAATRLTMREEIRRIQQSQGIATLLITHDQDEALSLGDRVAVLRDGRIEQIDAPQALYDHPVNEFVATFVGRANLLPATVHTRDVIDTALGRLQVAPHRLAAGTVVQVLIRPERIVPLFGSAPIHANKTASNVLEVQVRRDVFHGAVRHVDVAANAPGSPDAVAILKLETALRESFARVLIPSEAVQFLPAP